MLQAHQLKYCHGKRELALGQTYSDKFPNQISCNFAYTLNALIMAASTTYFKL